MKVTVLGCGTSTGVPRIGNDWGDCDPNNPKNRRTRSAIIVEHDSFRVLVDTGPDLRQQLLENDIDHVDAVIWTHDHADHCHGIDDLRQLYFRKRGPIAGFASERTADALLARFGYVFSGNAGYPATSTMTRLSDAMVIGPFRISSTEQPHGPITSTGLRFEANGKSVSYAIDFSSINESMVALYESADCLVCDCLREQPHPTHAHTDMALNLFEQTGAKSGLLTHMDKSMDYARLLSQLPPHIRPAYDGLTVEL
jgi:phosphoribosyl 1,2-cyclic phosphate phosphodiesterase